MFEKEAGHGNAPYIFIKMRYLGFGALIILLDQILKVLIRARLDIGETIRVIPGLAHITHVENTGVAFGMMSGAGIILIIFPLVIAAGIAVYLIREKDVKAPVALCLTAIGAGGLGNVIDRTFFGSVTDMISISFFPPVFNLADIAVTLGCFFLVIYVFLEERAGGKARADSAVDSSEE